VSTSEEVRSYILSVHLPGENPDMLSNDDDLLDMGILDSMAIMQLVDHLEKQYGITISTEEIDPANFESINALVAFIDKQRG
jgi:methoxymalonate biosynthesis acyl carrier protein